ncbi:MAG TPA: hypothetical protein VII94_02685 [Candidatus Saccharimonadales bacterium]
MRNQSVSDLVAAAMDAAINSKEHKALFSSQFKYASDVNDAKCTKCSKDKESCMCDSAMADDNDARKKKEDSSDSSSASDWNDARKKKEDSDSSSADDDDNDARKKKEDSDSSSADDEELEAAAAFDVAIDSLLTASAALDSVGLGQGSSLTLKIASLVVQAKKKEEKSKKDEKKKKDDKKKSSKDSQSAKDKKSDSKKSDSKKSDSKKSDKKPLFGKKPSSSSKSSK